MKVITLKQPHAGAIFTSPPLKTWETRGWATSYVGPLAIHAGKSVDDGVPAFMEDAWEEWEQRETAPLLRALGCIIGVVDVVSCVPTTSVRDHREWGDFGRGRYAFRLENPRLLKVPVPCRGQLGIWTYSGALGAFR